MSLRVGLNQKQWALARRLLGMGWDQNRIASHFMAHGPSLAKGLQHIRDKGLIIAPVAGASGVDVIGLKDDLRREILAELVAAGVLPETTKADVDVDNAVDAVIENRSETGEDAEVPTTTMSSGESADDGFDYSTMREE